MGIFRGLFIAAVLCIMIVLCFAVAIETINRRQDGVLHAQEVKRPEQVGAPKNFDEHLQQAVERVTEAHDEADIIAIEHLSSEVSPDGKTCLLSKPREYTIETYTFKFRVQRKGK